MNEKIEQGIKDIKYIMPLTEDQERIITLVLKEAYINGQISGIRRIVEPMTEEQTIEAIKSGELQVEQSTESTIL